MSPSSPNQAVLLVTGAWHVPEHYQKITSMLERKGVRVLCPCLPTNNNVLPPDKALADDVSLIRDIASSETQKGTQLIVVAHSYGGVVATDALAGCVVADGPATPGVKSILYLAAFIPFEGQSLGSIVYGTPPSFLNFLPNGTIEWTDPIAHLYNDVPSGEAERAKSMRVAHSIAAQTTAITCDKAAWRSFPVSYLFCETDQAIPLKVQEMMVERVKDEGVFVKELRCSGGHSPFLSMPEKVVDVILDVMSST